jgi:hypothetical protein
MPAHVVLVRTGQRADRHARIFAWVAAASPTIGPLRIEAIIAHDDNRPIGRQTALDAPPTFAKLGRFLMEHDDISHILAVFSTSTT